MASRKPKSPMRLTMKAFLPALAAESLLEVEADEQVRGEADALPADEHQQEARGQHQHQHEEHEEVQVGEEAPVALFVRHVADRVDVDQEADAGDDAQHDQREVVDGEGEVDLEAGDRDPRSADDREVRRVRRPTSCRSRAQRR